MAHNRRTKTRTTVDGSRGSFVIEIYGDTCECGEWMNDLIRDAFMEYKIDPGGLYFELECPNCGKRYSADCWIDAVTISVAEAE